MSGKDFYSSRKTLLLVKILISILSKFKDHLLDSCGGTYTLTDNPRIRYFSTDIEYPDEYDGVDLKEVDEGYGFELHLNQKFLHFRNACGWHKGFDVSKVSVKKNTLNVMLENLNG